MGYCIPPFVIFDRKTLNPSLTTGEVPGTSYGLSSNGWMDQNLFSDWFSHHFLVYAPAARYSYLSLPHSNAEVERIFSQVTLIKAKNRNIRYP